MNSELFPLRLWSNWWSVKAVSELRNSPFENGALYWSTSGLPSNMIGSTCYLAFSESLRLADVTECFIDLKNSICACSHAVHLKAQIAVVLMPKEHEEKKRHKQKNLVLITGQTRKAFSKVSLPGSDTKHLQEKLNNTWLQPIFSKIVHRVLTFLINRAMFISLLHHLHTCYYSTPVQCMISQMDQSGTFYSLFPLLLVCLVFLLLLYIPTNKPPPHT